MVKQWQLRKTQNQLKSTLVSCTWMFRALLSSLCSGQQLDISIATYQINHCTTFSFHNAQQTSYFRNPCSSAKCHVSDLTNLVSKLNLVLPQINMSLHLTQQALGFCCVTPDSQWRTGKILCSGDSGPVQRQGERTGVCVCL